MKKKQQQNKNKNIINYYYEYVFVNGKTFVHGHLFNWNYNNNKSTFYAVKLSYYIKMKMKKRKYNTNTIYQIWTQNRLLFALSFLPFTQSFVHILVSFRKWAVVYKSQTSNFWNRLISGVIQFSGKHIIWSWFDILLALWTRIS